MQLRVKTRELFGNVEQCSTFGRVAVKRRMEKEVVTLTTDAAEDEGKRNVKKR